MIILSRTALLASVALLAACSLTPDYQRPEITVPDAFAAKAEASAVAIDAVWWEKFGNNELNSLITLAGRQNLDIEAARQRVLQARAAVRTSNASLLPSISASGSQSGSYSRTKNSGAKVANSSTGTQRANISVAWEADLWGANRAGLSAVVSRRDASVFSREATTLSVQSEIVSTYIQAMAARDRLTIARENLEASQRILEIVRRQVEAGAAAPLDEIRQEGSVASIEASIPSLEKTSRAAETAMAILVGQAPEGFSLSGEGIASLALPAIASGQPAFLLERRPDIRQAEAQLIAANADIGAARAAFLPGLSISASDALTVASTGGTSMLASIAASLSAPIFTGGRLEAELDSSRARYAELEAGWKQTVLQSFKEVEDALNAAETASRRAEKLGISADRAQETYRISEAQYAVGAVDFSTVLDAQRSRLSAEDSLRQAMADRFLAAVDLFKALGGGWDT